MKLFNGVFAEELLPSDGNKALVDYKFMCFNGEPRYCLVCTDRNMSSFHPKFSLYSLPDWEKLSGCVVPEEEAEETISAPAGLKRMIECARILADSFPFVRIDLYNVMGKIYFGEMTFTPAAGRITYFSRRTLREMGRMIKLPNC